MGSFKRLLVERTEANPLFLEESVQALVETGALAGERGAYRLTRSVEQLTIPATVQAIRAARIDRLYPRAARFECHSDTALVSSWRELAGWPQARQ